MRTDRLSLAAFGLALLALGACSSAPRQSARDVDASVARSKGSTPAEPRSGASSEQEIGASAARHALAMRGKPYRYGGYTPQGFDCSGLVYYSYAQVSTKLPRSTEGLWSSSRGVPRKEIRPGDLLFFHQEGKRNSHVAIYVGNNRFVHAPSSGKQVSTASLGDRYWSQHFAEARRPVL